MPESSTTTNGSGCGVGGLYFAVSAVIYLCLRTFAPMEHWPAVLITVFWAPILAIIAFILCIPVAILLLPFTIPFLVIDARRKKKFIAGENLPDYLNPKVEACIEEDKKIFGDMSPDDLSKQEHSSTQAQDIIRTLLLNGEKYMRQNIGKWKELDETLEKLVKTSRPDLRAEFELLQKKRTRVGYLCRNFTHEDMPNEEELLEPKIQKRICAVGQNWQDYLASWGRLQEQYISPDKKEIEA